MLVGTSESPSSITKRRAFEHLLSVKTSSPCRTPAWHEHHLDGHAPAGQSAVISKGAGTYLQVLAWMLPLSTIKGCLRAYLSAQVGLGALRS